MTSNSKAEELLASGFFDRRMLIEIEAWEATFHLGVLPKHMSTEGAHLGGLIYVRGFDLNGRVLAPKDLRGGAIRVNMSPLPPKLLFISRATTTSVGSFYIEPENPTISDYALTLHMPEAELGYVATCLATNWKYLNVWVSKDDDAWSEVADYSFASNLHPNLDAWVAEE